MLTARDWFDDGSVYVVDVPLACCALETQAGAQGHPAAVQLGDVPAGATFVVTLSGTITAPVVPAIRAVIDAVPSPRRVVAFGACACVGGPYWDSYSVLPGAGALVEVDHVIAGCPPPPEALTGYLEGVRRELVG